MKILIAADMEGISGVTSWNHVYPDKPDYPRFRKLMTGDVNAAIKGVFDGGANAALVVDGHNRSDNLIIEELDRRARLISGTPSPLSMVAGVDSGVDGVLFIGYHARIGTVNAILDHTWSDERIANLWINDMLVGESALNGAVCGHFGVPVIMISGDQAVCDEATGQLGPLDTAVVKRAIGRYTAECLPPAEAQELICSTARRAVERLRRGEAPKPFHFNPPIRLVVELIQSDMADRAALMPGAKRIHERKIEYFAPDMVTAYQAFRTILALARN